MHTIVYSSLLVASSLIGAIEDGTKLEYQGQFVAVKGDPAASKKSFVLQIVAKDLTANGANVVWTMEEKGHGGWAWPDRVGVTDCDGRWHPVGSRRPALLYDREDGRSVVPVVLPLLPLPDGPLEKGTTWEWNTLQHVVTDTSKRLDRNCWKVEARNPYGVKRTLWVDQTQPIVVAMRERVFIGQGLEFDLTLELASQSKLAAPDVAKIDTALAAVQKLLEKLAREPQTQNATWNDDQLATLKADTATAAALAETEFLAPLAKALDADVKSQKNRAGAIAAFRERVVGTTVDQLKLDALSGEGISAADFKDKVTVLHFWEYRDAPLEEPYGQIGYLDFFFRKLKGKNVAVFGVVVDDGANDPTARRKIVRSANGIKNFMNLSYPLLMDDGTVLKRFGDPRTAGAKLPLFVVIDKNGKVVEYHAGYYEVNRDRGLEELDKIVTKAAGNRE